MVEKKSVRDTPPDTGEDWRSIWSGVDKAHAGWPVVSFLNALFRSRRVLIGGILIAIMFGGPDALANIKALLGAWK